MDADAWAPSAPPGTASAIFPLPPTRHRYTPSPGGEDLIGWHVNRGLDQAADFYPAETFRSTFHRPDLVQAALDKA
ncbi:MAG: hypothetical protein WAN86_01160 [Hyphomicrobiaceae bacterium]